MILSILVSVYNFDCRALVEKLLWQLPDGCEVVVADDASTDAQMRLDNRAFIAQKESVRYWESPENSGRAKIRNALARQARGEWLLFLDCDAMPFDDDFLHRYIMEIGQADVVCGGTQCMPHCPSPMMRLRYKYEQKYWKNNSAEKRNQRPYDSFTTFNFMIRKSVFDAIRFNSQCYEYGHEDTLFGRELAERGVSIKHVDNAAIHTGLDANGEFLKKTETALVSLVRIDPGMTFPSGIARAYRLLKRWRLLSLFRFWHSLSAKVVRSNLTGEHPSLMLFQLYKLGVFCELNKESGIPSFAEKKKVQE